MMLFDEQGLLKIDKLKSSLIHGVGQIARISDTGGGQSARGMAELSNSLQKYFLEETRPGNRTRTFGVYRYSYAVYCGAGRF